MQRRVRKLRKSKEKVLSQRNSAVLNQKLRNSPTWGKMEEVLRKNQLKNSEPH